MVKKIKRLRNTPFDDVFRTLLEKCNKLIIPVINEVFNADYTMKDEVLVLANEQFFIDDNGNTIKNVTDSYLKIRDIIYHIECQSTDDSYMEIRMFEYDIHIALDNMYHDDEDGFILEMPQSAVLVLRESTSFGEKLDVKLRIPRYNEAGAYYEGVNYSIPVCNVTKYSKDDICKKNLLFLTPYYIIRFEKRLAQINDDANQLNELKAEYQELYEELAVFAEREDISRDYLHDMICLTEKIIEHIAKDMENVKREVKQMGGNILKLDREILVEEAEKRGEELGEVIAMQLVSRMMSNGCSQDEIDRVSSDKEYREEMYKKYSIK